MTFRAGRRHGFTLIEIMIAVTLLGIIGSILTAVLVRQQVAHMVVLLREQRMKHRQSNPPVVGESREAEARLRIGR